MIIVGATGCTLPTDESIGAFVTVDAPDSVVVRGRQTILTGHLWLKRGNADSTEIPNAILTWSELDAHDAVLAPTGQHGSVFITGVNRGRDTIVVTAPTFQHATAATFVLRIADALEIDSVRPTTAYYGDEVTLYGVGVGNVLFAEMGGVPLLPDTFSTRGDSIGLAQQSFWVPYPADTNPVLALGDQEFKVSRDTVAVIPQDLYDPNSASPAIIDLGAAPPFPALPAVRFYNPALAFENLATTGLDWFRFTVPDSTQAYTFYLTAPGLDGTDSVYVASAGRGAMPPVWATGPGYADCKGSAFRPSHVPFAGLLAPMFHTHGSTTDLAAVFTSAGQYGMIVFQGYLVTDTTVLPDHFESSSDCLFADENFANAATHIDLGTAFSDVLSIDHPFEVDWLRVHVPGVAPTTVTVAVQGNPLPTTSPSSELDLYLLSVPTDSSGLNPVAQQVGSGATKSITLAVAPGDYYVVVVDASGAVTPYGICAAAAFSCTPSSSTTVATARIRPPKIVPFSRALRRLTDVHSSARRAIPRGHRSGRAP